jgi:hypothetical protein
MSRQHVVLVAAILAACTTSPTTPPAEEFTPPPPAPFTLEVREGINHTVARGEVLPVILKIHRDAGFEDPIHFSAVTTPGIVVIFRPSIVLHREETDLLIVADQSVTAITHDVHLVGKVSGKADRSVVLKLTVAPGP